jgi:hypothetical protein
MLWCTDARLPGSGTSRIAAKAPRDSHGEGGGRAASGAVASAGATSAVTAAAAPDPWDIFGGDGGGDKESAGPTAPAALRQVPAGGTETGAGRASGVALALPQVVKPGYGAYGGGGAGGAGVGVGGSKLPGALGGLGGSGQGSRGGDTWTGSAVMGRDHCERARVLCDVHTSLDFLIQHAPGLHCMRQALLLPSWHLPGERRLNILDLSDYLYPPYPLALRPSITALLRHPFL